jgi:hypothetical protein
VDKKSKITLYIGVALIGIAAIVMIISFKVSKKDFFPDIPETTTDTSAKGEPKIIVIEKDPEVDKRKAIRNSFEKYITAQQDGFNASTFGGITNLKVKVRNEMAYVVDRVEIQVQYIKAGGGVFKTETVYADNIKPNAPNASLVINAPDSNRGTNVELKIIAVTSRQLSLCYVYGKQGADVEDPYFCN